MTTREMENTVYNYLGAFMRDLFDIAQRKSIYHVSRRGGPGYEEFCIKYADRDDEHDATTSSV